MKFLSSLRSGFSRALSARRMVLVWWFTFFILVILFVYPMRSTINTAVGSSMITERLAEGLDIDMITDLGQTLRSIISYFSAGMLFVYLAGFLLNAFVSGGIFGLLRNKADGTGPDEFFRAGARNFWPNIIILFIVTIILFVSMAILLSLTIGAAATPGKVSESVMNIILVSSGVVMLIIIAVLLLVADYARAWVATERNRSGLQALGFGFGETFGKFRSSILMMLILVIVQVFFVLLMMRILSAWTPSSSGGVFLLLIVSQVMLYVRLMLKTWRYASVTSLMERNSEKIAE